MTYLRIAVTDRCNLRCFYCMPEEGINFLPKRELLTYEEILRLSSIFVSLGVDKIRITGGEPFVRKDLMPFLKELKALPGLAKLHLTTNGVLTESYLADLEAIDLNGINLSLDSLDRENFRKITHRDEFERVNRCLDALTYSSIQTKINTVVMRGLNDHELLDLALLAKDNDLQVRFIEEMPFNGRTESNKELVSHQEIKDRLTQAFGPMSNANPTGSSDPASLYSPAGFKGKIGIIPSYTRTFCGSCNRIRLTATGTMKNCLYDEGVFDLKQLLRSGASDEEIRTQLISIVSKKEKNGRVVEANRAKSQTISESMSEIGG